MTFSKKYYSKQKSVVAAMQMFGVSKQDLLDLYEPGDFDGRVTKSSLKEFMSLDISNETKNKLKEICDISFTRDRRTPVEYALDLVFGWVVEDCVLLYLNNKGINAELVGADKFRDFLPGNKIKSDSDMTVEGRNTDIYVDLDGYWSKNNSLDLRMSKYNKMIKQESILLGISPQDSKIILLDLSQKHDIEIRNNPLWGGKEVATINNISEKLNGLDIFDKSLYNIIH